MSGWEAHLGYALAWAGFGLTHSLLAREPVKAALRPALGAYYRFTYNLLAAVQVAMVWGIGWALLGGGSAIGLPVNAVYALWIVHLIGWLALILALLGYDLGRLSGLQQIRAYRAALDEPEDEPLRLDGLHAYVRHPAYAAAFLILWGRAVDAFGLATALWGSLYLVIGAHFEERWLIRHYGPVYEDYRRRVPAFLPWKGRAIEGPGG